MAIEALRVLHDKGFTNIKWYVIGYGGYEDTLRQLITKYDLQDSFVLLGKKQIHIHISKHVISMFNPPDTKARQLQ